MPIELDTTKIRSFADLKDRVVTAPLGGAVLPTLPLPTAWGTGWEHFGLLSDAGIRKGYSTQQNKVYAHQGGVVARVLRSQSEEPFTITCLERNPVSLGLKYPGATITVVGGTDEVQTVTINGVPTGGTHKLSFREELTSALAFNATAATVKTALEALRTIGTGNVTVAGSAGGPYTVTFVVALGKQAVPMLLMADNSLTGGTAPANPPTIAETTPGVNSTNTWKTSPSSGQNIRLFGLDEVDGTLYYRTYWKGEAVRSGESVNARGQVETIEFVIYPYPDADGNTLTLITNDPAYQSGLFV